MAAICLSAAASGSACAAEPTTATADPGAGSEARRLALCSAASMASLPRNAAERRALLQRLEGLRERCLDHPGFLAALGGSWLEEGNPVQALLWLERALMLDPEQLAARADHALALSALGERQALDELVRDWRLRTDIPAPLVERLVAAVNGAQSASITGPSTNGNGRWAQSRELLLLFGHESNLDRSPRLTELTINFPDGPLDLAVDLKPKAGAALAAEGSWQAAYSPTPGALFQAGLQAGGRSAPGQPSTDWHHVQAAAAVSQRWSQVRIELQGSVTAIGGQLNEPYRLTRWGVSLQSNGLGCNHRLSLDVETRHQAVTEQANSKTLGGFLSSVCPLSFAGGWTVGAALRASTDVPDNPIRPGGTQRQWSVGLRAFGPAGRTGQIEVSARFTAALDSETYNTLLSPDRRVLKPVQLAAEYSRPFALLGQSDTDLVAQLQAVRQSSNLSVFRYTAVSAFTGLRWRW